MTQRQRTLFAPTLTFDHRRGAIRRWGAVRDDQRRAPAVFVERFGFLAVGDQSAVGKFADAARGIAGDPLPEPAIMNVAAVGVRCEPFANRKCVAAAMVDGEPTVSAAQGEAAAVGGNQYVRLRRARRQNDRDHDEEHSAPAQRRLEQADQ